MRCYPLRARAAGEVAREILEEAAQNRSIVVGTVFEAEETAILCRRDKIDLAIEAWVARSADVKLLQKRQQAIDALLFSSHPAVEVEAIRDLVPVSSLVELVDLATIAGTGEHEGERRTQVAQSDVQPTPKVGEGVQGLEALGHLGAGGLVLEGPCVVEGVAAIFEVAREAGLPELLVSHPPDEALKDGAFETLRVGNDAPEVEVHNRDAGIGLARDESLLNNPLEQRKLPRVAIQEVDQPTFIDCEKSYFTLGPC
jgi:hypothetical protein